MIPRLSVYDGTTRDFIDPEISYVTRVEQMVLNEEIEELLEEELLEDETIEVRGKKRKKKKRSTVSDFVC